MKDISIEEKEKIEIAIQTFCRGVTECNYKEIFKVFLPEAKSVVVNQKTDEMISVTREHWKEMFEKEPCDPEIKSWFEIVNVVAYGTLAFAYVKIFDEYKDRIVTYTDFLSLLKLKENWCIIHKTGHGEQEFK